MKLLSNNKFTGMYNKNIRAYHNRITVIFISNKALITCAKFLHIPTYRINEDDSLNWVETTCDLIFLFCG